MIYSYLDSHQFQNRMWSQSSAYRRLLIENYKYFEPCFSSGEEKVIRVKFNLLNTMPMFIEKLKAKAWDDIKTTWDADLKALFDKDEE